ncbi:B3 domain-containing protein At5g57720 isoform X1 [Coffea arabica]|uniref:B3 domain-containing protein At5g57720-like isoform X1 n=2 Tax=Coffea arabica TaxID=13443 RepID=A0A6P6TYC6_COFAR|nr:B3 domain-containing protein At5g57720-like isoform X1 [Coffea arabica]XP_027083405.1 B3 domain-containing protein At5g57720-like isoform X1 [Coffea arabica]XP_027083406.1 B3 domain-containing protein At5g57720-like isoform X1 [Coffea arabica]XP_027083407.1 B3 domain-containing protein At5g57720-like isoform X1 [Coffea arabica]XP_027083408.1 B3 domain-containing protein At5g57720-like isoform X1 [Coffea arabica]
MANPQARANLATQAQSQRNLKFCKVFDANKYFNKLHIPSAYASYMRGNLPDRAVLRDCDGNMWAVELAKVGSEWFFQEGWAKVVQDNLIEHQDFLVFLFDGEKVFDFTIIGNNLLEKEGVGSLKFQLEVEKGNGNGEKAQELNDMNGDNLIEEKEQPLNGVKRDFQKLTSPTSGSRKYRSEKNGQEGASASDGIKKKARHDLYGASIFRSGEHALPENPYFVTRIRTKRQNALFIPIDVIKDFRLDLPENMTLRDPLGRTWPAYLRTWKDGRAYYSGGWDNLCKVNSIDEEDDCVCEFVPGRGQEKPVMQIQIIRQKNAPETCD